MYPHLFFFFLPGASPPGLVSVPDVVGQDQASAEAEIAGEGLLFAIVTAYSGTVPAGDVISQSPAAGSLVSAGSTVTITVSLGAQPDTGATGGWDYGTARERKRKTKKELLEERIALGILPAPVVEALPEPVQAKVKKAGTVTLRALLGGAKADAMNAQQLEAELVRIHEKARKRRLQREDEELLLL